MSAVGRAALLVLLCVASPIVGANEFGPPMRVCLLTNNLPYSERASASGFG